MESVWDITQVLIMLSVWCEAWGLVCVEAQIRGIPVISSDAGAPPEAKPKVPYIISVSKLTGERDENGHVFKPQDVQGWVDTLTYLITGRDEYEQISDMSSKVTSDWVTNLCPHTQENWLMGMMAGCHLD
jgi:glycosyltransferase involved in cell wall biosynthesis